MGCLVKDVATECFDTQRPDNRMFHLGHGYWMFLRCKEVIMLHCSCIMEVLSPPLLIGVDKECG